MYRVLHLFYSMFLCGAVRPPSLDSEIWVRLPRPIPFDKTPPGSAATGQKEAVVEENPFVKSVDSAADLDSLKPAGMCVLSVETHRRAATANTKSREVAGALAGTAPSSTARNSVTRPEIPENVGRAT